MNLRPSLVLYALFLAFGSVAHAIDPTVPDELIVPLGASALWGIPLAVFAFVRSPFNRLVGYAWILWALIGAINVIASYLFYGDHYLVEVAETHVIYLVFAAVFFAGLFVQEQLARFVPTTVPPPPTDAVHPWVVRALLVFPVLWFASVYLTLGYVPIMLGIDIGDDMYELDYGPLYGLALLLALSMLMALECSAAARTPLRRWGFGALVVVFGACSMIDSKRVTLMVGMAAMFVYFIRVKGTSFLRTATVALVLTAGATAYFAGQIIRKGLDMEILDRTELQLSTVGVEYRDFVYSVNNFEPERIPDYDWALSAGAAMINSSVLEAMGADKQALVERGSAYAWKNLLGSDFGIRTGIVCELYFAYGYFGLAVIFVFGMLSAWVSAQLAHARTKLGLIFISVVYGMLLLAIVGQTMATTGSFTTLLYAWVAAWLVRSLVPHASSSSQLQ